MKKPEDHKTYCGIKVMDGKVCWYYNYGASIEDGISKFKVCQYWMRYRYYHLQNIIRKIFRRIHGHSLFRSGEYINGDVLTGFIATNKMGIYFGRQYHFLYLLGFID